MNRELVIGGIIIMVAVVALFIFRGPSEVRNRTETIAPQGKNIEEQKAVPRQSQKKEIASPAVTQGIAAGKDDGTVLEDDKASADMQEENEEASDVATSDQGSTEPVVLVNNVPVSINSVVPPDTSFPPGTPMAEAGYKAFINTAIDRELVVQKAREMGIMDSEQYQSVIENLRPEFAETDPTASKEEVDWEVNYFATSAIVNEVYRKEGLMPRKVADEEVEENYSNRSNEYNWLRERERARGTAEDKIEQRVREQIERDLQEPLVREARKKQREYLDGLREEANIEYPKDEAK